MPGKEPQLGDVVEIHCKYCRLNLDGNVAAVLDGEIIKVQCRTCRHFQDYRPPIPESERRARLMKQVTRLRDRRLPLPPTPKKSEEKPEVQSSKNEYSPEAVARKMWDEATKNVNPLKARIYNPDHIYGVSDMLVHHQHGLGVVSEIRQDGTIIVLFREGFKRLSHGMAKAGQTES